MRKIVLIAHDIRSAHNVGSLLRTAEGLGLNKVILSGYTPYPKQTNDTRLPHLAQKIHNQISKTALGAEESGIWEHVEDVRTVIKNLQEENYAVTGLEQTKQAIPLPSYRPSDAVAILLGREVEGIDQSLLKLCDEYIEIPMFGQKESFNVVQAAAMVSYHIKFFPFQA
jgi:23S rRNA (guanosine2251-2'-O)-methyltransferase